MLARASMRLDYLRTDELGFVDVVRALSYPGQRRRAGLAFLERFIEMSGPTRWPADSPPPLTTSM